MLVHAPVHKYLSNNNGHIVIGKLQLYHGKQMKATALAVRLCIANVANQVHVL